MLTGQLVSSGLRRCAPKLCRCITSSEPNWPRLRPLNVVAVLLTYEMHSELSQNRPLFGQPAVDRTVAVVPLALRSAVRYVTSVGVVLNSSVHWCPISTNEMLMP